MYLNVNIKNVSWPHFSWATLYFCRWFHFEMNHVPIHVHSADDICIISDTFDYSEIILATPLKQFQWLKYFYWIKESPFKQHTLFSVTNMLKYGNLDVAHLKVIQGQMSYLYTCHLKAQFISCLSLKRLAHVK